MDWLRLLLDPEAAPGGGAPDAGADNLPGDSAEESLPPDTGELPDDNAAEPEAEAENQPEAGTEGSEGAESRLDGRVIPAWMRALKETDPKAYAAAKNDLFDLRARRGIHATTKEAESEHNLVKAIGGPEGVATLRENAQVYQEAASQFRKGDPAFVQDLWNEDPIAAALHVQPMLDAMKAKDGEGYKGMVCRMWHGEFAAVGLPGAIKSLKAAIEAGDKKAAGELLDGITNWQQSISDLATRAEDPRVKTLLAERAKGEDAKVNAELETLNKSYRTDATNAIVSDAERVFDSHFKNKASTLDKEDRLDLLREAITIADREVQKDASYIEQRDKHLARRDTASALQLLKSRYNRELDSAVKRVARRYGLISGAPNAPKQGQPGAGAPKGGTPPPTGFIRVNERPAADQIDRARTSASDIISGKATLIGGKKVTWVHLKKSQKVA